MKRRNIGIAAMLIVVLGNVANAGTIEYAWEGWLTPLDVNADPSDWVDSVKVNQCVIGATKMNYRENLTWARIAPLLLLIGTGAAVLAVPGRPAMAELIKYEWSGTMTPLEANVDPWNIGAEKGFVISVLVNQDSLDLDASLVVARFDLLDAELLIDGVPQESFDRGVILIEDRDFGDSLSIILFDVEFNGVREGFFTGARLPSSTFTLTSMVEAPPVFSPAMMISTGGGVSDDSSYATTRHAGTIVTGALIPEPSTFVLSLLAAIGVGFARWRNRIR